VQIFKNNKYEQAFNDDEILKAHCKINDSSFSKVEELDNADKDVDEMIELITSSLEDTK